MTVNRVVCVGSGPVLPDEREASPAFVHSGRLVLLHQEYESDPPPFPLDRTSPPPEFDPGFWTVEVHVEEG